MSRVQVDGGDANVGCREVTHDIAAARSDSDQVLAVLEHQRLEVDDGVLPDLRIDEARKSQREQTLLDALVGGGLVAMDGIAQPSLLATGGRRQFVPP